MRAAEAEQKHGLEFIECDGDGWEAQCFCGETFWRLYETSALNAIAEHEEAEQSK